MGWADEIADGHNELLADGAGVIILYKGKEIPAMLGSGITLDQLVDGGNSESINPTLSIHRSALSSAGWTPEQGDTFTIKQASDHTLKIKSLGFDPADPLMKIYAEGEQQ